MLDSNKNSLIVLALKDIIASDDTIEPETIVEKVNNMTKEDIVSCNSFVLEDFLAGIFLYTVLNVENRNCENSVREITDEYIQSFETQKKSIKFITTYNNFSMEAANEVAIDARALVLLAETGGRCQKCGRILGIKKKATILTTLRSFAFQKLTILFYVLTVNAKFEIYLKKINWLYYPTSMT